MSDPYEGIAERLVAIEEELRDLAYERLREAARSPEDDTGIAAAGVPTVRSRRIRVVVQDPCHLRHVQKSHAAVRTVLAPAYDLVETGDDGLCCGAGGAYVVTQPELSARILERKLEALRAAAGTDSPIVASANPGCMVQLRRAGIDARHPADLLAEALDV